MTPTREGSFHLFRFAGIDVFIHWLWLFAVLYFVQASNRVYSTPVWNVIECLGLFTIVLLHEFGHSLACRQVGGRADQIVLWPLGGVAYVDPPQRPGPVLWSIAAGPLVNVALIPVFWLLIRADQNFDLFASVPSAAKLLRNLAWINLVLLGFNMLPAYPLDGGQILRSLLWFVVGPIRSLYAAVAVGFLGVAALAVYAFLQRSIWMGIMAFFAFSQCRAGWERARGLKQLADLPRRDNFTCPLCRVHPPIGNFWRCDSCQAPFDPFETAAECPSCRTRFATTFCPDCRTSSPFPDWRS